MAGTVRRIPGLLLVGLALFGLVAHLLLNMGLRVPAPLLPILLLLPLAWLPRRPPATDGPDGPPSRWSLTLGFWLVAALCLLPPLLASLEGFMPSEDGWAAWMPRTRHLALTGGLEQPVFRDFRLFCHSQCYPLFQPLVVASALRLVGDPAGTAVVPLLWLLLLGLAWQGFLRAGLGRGVAALAALSLGLTPMLLSPGAGAIDSGYGDFLVMLLLTAAALGLHLRDPVQVGAAVLLLPWMKPEGIVYGLLICMVAWALAPRRVSTPALIAYAISLQLWLPLEMALAQEGAAPGFQAFTPWLAGALLAGLLAKEGLVRLGSKPHHLGLILAGVVLLTLVALHLWRAELGSRGGALFGVFLAHVDRLWQGLSCLPEILAAWGELFFFVRKYGLVFPILAALLLLPRRVAGRCPDRPLAVLVGLGLAVTLVPFLIQSEEQLAHNLRSRLDRLFLHWVGPAWVLGAIWLLPALWRGDGRSPGPPADPRPGPAD